MTQRAKRKKPTRKKPTKRLEQNETDLIDLDALAEDLVRAHMKGIRNVFNYPALHRYFLHASRNRDLFVAEQTRSPHLLHKDRSRAHLELWYACLITVLEGWKREKINHAPVTEMARDHRKIDLLKKYRNAVFHYSPDYDDPRFVAVSEEADFVERLANLLQSAAQANGVRGRASRWCPISSSPVTRRVDHGASTCSRQVGITKSEALRRRRL
jgi:hypothetical protein